MGTAIIQVLSQSSKSILGSAVVSEQSVYLGLDSGLHTIHKENKITFNANLEEIASVCDVWIDFSESRSIQRNLDIMVKANRPIVIGTTGFNEEDKKKIKQASSSIPIVYSPNMSVGVNLLFKLTEIASKVLEDFDIEILDIHHRHKKDSPSGTTVRLKEVLLESLKRNESNVIYGRHGIYPERDKKEIGIHTMRAGEVIGEHTVQFFSAEERIEITHKAGDRKTFAVGAVRASEFLYGKKSGLFDMMDVLGIK
jgi:4-hydroxy-tetrahydrodipicolinate reductase